MIHSQPSCLNVILELLNRCDTGECVFPPTDLYNEGWMLRIVVDWFSKQDPSNHELSFSEGSTWFSEALFPSPFLPRFRGDPLLESWPHADGVMGHIKIGRGGKADITILADAEHLVVTEANSNGVFDSPLDKADIRQKVERRVQAYEGQKDAWFGEWFLPVLEQVDVKPISWESIQDFIDLKDPPFGNDLRDFHSKCIKYNRPANYTNKRLNRSDKAN